jgi:transcriptional regulator with XRE-family HTH domain
MDIGKRIRAERKAAGLSQEQLARRSDVPLNRVARIETGVVVDPHISTLHRIASGLDMTVSELLQEDHTSPKASASPSSSIKEEKVGHRRGDWVADSLERTVNLWVGEVEKRDVRTSFAIAVACLDIAQGILRFDLPGATLQDRVPAEEVDERLRWVERLFNLSQRAQENYAQSPEAKPADLERYRARRADIEQRTPEIIGVAS